VLVEALIRPVSSRRTHIALARHGLARAASARHHVGRPAPRNGGQMTYTVDGITESGMGCGFRRDSPNRAQTILKQLRQTMRCAAALDTRGA
jgi:hypothetical protein